MPLNAVTKIPALAFVGVMEVIASSRVYAPWFPAVPCGNEGFFSAVFFKLEFTLFRKYSARSRKAS